MDPFTHGLASLALQRGFFPRTSWRAVLAIVCAGVIADVDWFTASLGPATYLRWHRTATHSIAFVGVLAVATYLFSYAIQKKDALANWIGLSWIAAGAAASLHVVMDLTQADAVAPLWPFSAKRFSLDIAPSLDPWPLTILAAAILFPELVRLVSDEIGAHTKRPRGRSGAFVGLAFALAYFALRALLHGNTTAALEARTIVGESPRRVAAFPDSASPFLWPSIVETESALHLATMRSMSGEVTFATGITSLRKPESSAVLSTAQASPAAIAFLKVARFPKATVLKEAQGYSVEIQDLKDQATEERSRAIFADINLDNSAKVISSELQWQKTPTHP